MLLKIINYYLNTDATQRAQDRADFKQLVQDSKEKKAHAENMERALVFSGRCVQSIYGTFGDLLDNIEVRCSTFQSETQGYCVNKKCPYQSENHQYFDALRAYGMALVKEKKFWSERRDLRNVQAACVRQERNTKIEHLGAECADLENELTLAKSVISTCVRINPNSGAFVKKGCFVSTYSGSGDWTALDSGGQSHDFTLNKKCAEFATPCKHDCPYREKNAHYAEILNSYNVARAAYRMAAGKDWVPTKTK